MSTINNNNSNSKKGPSYTNHNGFLMPFGFPAQNFSNALTYQSQPNDLFVATYPKCGTTLMQHIIYTMLNNDGVPIQPHERLDQIFPHLEEVGADYIDKCNSTGLNIRRGKRLIKTHLPYDWMKPMMMVESSSSSPSSGAKYIFVARNPKDCIVSFYHHTRGFPQHYDFENGDFDVFFELFCQGKVDFGDYFHTLRSWFNHRHDDHVLFVKYEDVCRDKRNVILQIADFIGGQELRQELLRNDECLMKKVLHHTSLEEMKKDPLRWCSERKVEHTPFIRLGQVGGWKELLSRDQEEILNGIMKEKFSREELMNDLGKDYYSPKHIS
mmetsp:Transcript_9137/g.17206  ORF Transcript_9137/g.17206 Transcript_9137/m.17206 type:complete len:326 (-) Transcript_9137:118-1095(-)